MASYPYPTFSKPYENYGYEALTVTDTAAGFTLTVPEARAYGKVWLKMKARLGG